MIEVILSKKYETTFKDFSIESVLLWAFTVALEPQQKPREKDALY